MKKISLLIALVSSFLPALALRIVYGNNIIINEPTHENLYVAGVNITINAAVHGDLIIAGGTVVINDTITNDILVAGGRVTFNGFAGDDIRCAGGKIYIRKNVTGDLVVTGGTILIDKGVTIGNLITSGGSITVDGNVDGDVNGVFNDLILNGTVSKNLDCRGGIITLNGSVNGNAILAASDITIGNNATFYRDVRYWNKKGFVEFKQSLRGSKAIYDRSLRIRTSEWYFLGTTTLTGLFLYLGMAFVMILFIQYLFSATLKNAADSVFNHSVKSLVLGILFLIGAPIAIVLSIITIVGIPIGLIAGICFITVILLSTSICSVLAANWANNLFYKKWNFPRLSLAAFGIFILLKFLSMTPFVGWLIMILLSCMAFGSLLLNIHPRKNELTAQS